MTNEAISNKESRLIQVVMIEECLKHTYPEESNKIDAIAFLICAIRHYCEFNRISFHACNTLASGFFEEERG